MFRNLVALPRGPRPPPHFSLNYIVDQQKQRWRKQILAVIHLIPKLYPVANPLSLTQYTVVHEFDLKEDWSIKSNSQLIRHEDLLEKVVKRSTGSYRNFYTIEYDLMI